MFFIKNKLVLICHLLVLFVLFPAPPCWSQYKNLKSNLAIIDFENRTTYADLGAGALDMLTTALWEGDRFILLERDNIKSILREQELSHSGRVSPEAAIELGRLLGAEYILTGGVTEAGLIKENGKVSCRVVLDARLIDAVNGRVVLTETAEGKASGSNLDTAVRQAVFHLADKINALVDRKPWQSTIIKTDKKEAYGKLKKTVALINFSSASPVIGADVGPAITDILVTALVKSDRFIVIEREKLNRILFEQILAKKAVTTAGETELQALESPDKLVVTGLITSKTAIAVGKILHADIVITGRVINFGLENTGRDEDYFLVGLEAHLISTRTGKTLLVKEVLARSASEIKRMDLEQLDFAKEAFVKTLIGEATREAVNQLVRQIEEISEYETKEAELVPADVDAGKVTFEEQWPKVERLMKELRESLYKKPRETAMLASGGVVLLPCTKLTAEEKELLEQLEKEFTILIKLDPNIAGWYINQAYIYHDINRFDKAISLAEKAVSLAPGDPDVRYALAGLYLSLLDKYTERSKGGIHAVAGVGILSVIYHRDEDYEEGDSVLKKIRDEQRITGDDLERWRWEYVRNTELYLELAQNKITPEQRKDIIMTIVYSMYIDIWENYDRCIVVLSDMAKTVKDDALLWNALATAYGVKSISKKSKQAMDKAEECSRKAVALEPGNRWFHEQLAVIYSLKGGYYTDGTGVSTIYLLDEGIGLGYEPEFLYPDPAEKQKYRKLAEEEIAVYKAAE